MKNNLEKVTFSIDSSIPDHEQPFYREQPVPQLRVVGAEALREAAWGSSGDGLPIHFRRIDTPVSSEETEVSS